MALGKLDARITVPTGGYTVNYSDTAGAHTATIAAGNYYHGSVGGAGTFVSVFQAALRAGTGLDSWTVTLAAGEGGTGKVTMNSGSGAWSVTWTGTSTGTIVRDLCGFDADLGSASGARTGVNQGRAMWFPNCPPDNYQQENTPSSANGTTHAGWIESDFRVAQMFGGHIYARKDSRKKVNSLVWPAVSAAKTWAAYRTNPGATLDPQAFETFMMDAIRGDADWGIPGGPIRWYPNAAVNSTYVDYYVALGREWSPQPTFPQQMLLWRIELPRLIKVP